MDDYIFLLQVEDGIMSEEVNCFYHRLQEHNWLFPADQYGIQKVSLEDVRDIDVIGKTPVGSLEFVAEVLVRGYGIERIKPMLIPEELKTYGYLGRKVKITHSVKETSTVLSEWGVDNLFIKSASVPKCDYADAYTRRDRFPQDTDYLVSEVIDIKSEWRAFVSEGKVQDIRNYSGDEWTMPNKAAVLEMVSVFTKAPPAYTLDVAVLASGETVLVEVHNFIACGLYGMTRAELLNMARNGFEYEIQHSLYT